MIQSHLGRCHTVEGGLINVSRLGILHHVFEIADVEHPGNQVGCQPVGHDTSQHLIDIEKRLQEPRDRSPNRTGQTAAHKGNDPNQPRRDHLGRDAQRQHQGHHGAHQILSRGADIEQARLESHRHGESCQDQRRRPEKHVPDVGGVKSKSQGSRCIPACAEQAAKNQPDSIPRTGGREGIAGHPHNQDNDTAHHKPNDDGENGG